MTINKIPNRQVIPGHAQAADLPDAHRGQQGTAAKVLPSMDVREMHLHHRRVDGGDGVAQGHRRVGEAAGIEDDTLDGVAVSLVQPVDERAFMVALEKVERHAGKGRAEVGFEVGQRVVAVGLRLACAEQVEVRPVEDEEVQDSALRVQGCGF